MSYYGSTQLFYIFNDFKPRADVILGIMRGVDASHPTHA